MFSVSIQSTVGAGSVSLGNHTVTFTIKQSVSKEVQIQAAKAKLIRKWLFGFVQNRVIAYEKASRCPEKYHAGTILMSYLNELERMPWYKTFKSVSVHADKYMSLAKKKRSHQNIVLEAIISECKKLNSLGASMLATGRAQYGNTNHLHS